MNGQDNGQETERDDIDGWDHFVEEGAPIVFEGEILRDLKPTDKMPKGSYQVKFSDGLVAFIPKQVLLCEMEEVGRTGRLPLDSAYAEKMGWC